MENTIYLKHRIKCNLKDLCKDHVANSRGEFCIECPECLTYLNSRNQKLYIKSDFSVGFCQRCKSVFINDTDHDDEVNLLTTPSFDFNNINYTLSKINTNYYESSNDEDLEGYSYLIKRNPFIARVLPRLKFKYRTHKIVMPFYWNNELIYYQIRSTLNRDEALIPYFMPPIDNKPIWFNPLNTGSKELIMTEGIFGAIAAWLNYNGKIDTISIQGSYLTKYQMWMIDSLSYQKYYMYFDDDGINAELKLNLYNHDPLIYSNIELIHSKLGDPEDDFLGKTIKH